MKNRVLLLVEGQDEYIFFERMGKVAFGEKVLEIVTLRCNIYSLFRTMREYDFDIDLETAISLSPNCSLEDKEKLKGSTFPFKYLVFDFDFQEKTMNQEEKVEALRQMSAFFDDDSDQGFLFVNYPMFESLREKSEEGISKCQYNPFDKEPYKRIIDKRGDKMDYGKLNRKQFLNLAFKSILFSNFILRGKYCQPKVLEESLTLPLLERQLAAISKGGSLYCLNTSAQLPCYYFGLSILK